MRYFRRLPPLLRVVSILGLLCALAASVAFAQLFVRILYSLSTDSWRVLMIALNLGVLSGACSFAVRTSSARLRQPDGRPLPASSWQNPAWAIVLVTALPLCALVLAVFIPPTAAAFGVVFPISMFATIMLLALRFGAASSGPMRTPSAW
jgi:hypothetical protein